MPVARKSPRKPDARADSGALPFGINVRLTPEQHEALAALGPNRSAAIRQVIDEWRGRKVQAATVTKMGFTGVPELDHIEFVLEAVDHETGVTQRQELNLDLGLASDLLADLAEAVRRLEPEDA